MSDPNLQSATSIRAWFSRSATVVGHVRKINEDAFLDSQEIGLWAVADGMGGHSRGDRASQQIISRLEQFHSTDDAQDDLQLLGELLDEANQYCRDVAGTEVMGSTIAMLYIRENIAYLLWAGDSRIYLYRDNQMQQLTEDHSLVQELHRLGELTEDEAENHPSANVITRAVGVADQLDVQLAEVDLQRGDRFLLCSDGLFKDVAKSELQENLGLPSMEHAVDQMVQLALKRGGTDNITAIVVQMNNDPAANEHETT